MRWPPLFSPYLSWLALPIDLEFLSLDCVSGEPLSFYHRMLGTLLLPVIGSATLITLAAIAIAIEFRGRLHWRELRLLIASPGMWMLHIWMLLLLYPALCKKALATFDCVEVRGVFFLRHDPGLECYDT